MDRAKQLLNEPNQKITLHPRDNDWQRAQEYGGKPPPKVDQTAAICCTLASNKRISIKETILEEVIKSFGAFFPGIQFFSFIKLTAVV